MHRLTHAALACLAAIAMAASPSQALAQSNRATFPENFARYVLYAKYDRGSSWEEAFALPETIAFSKTGQPLPPGTRLVLGIWSNNTHTGYFVMEKGAGWGLENPEELRTGDWHFQEFDINGQVRRTAIAERCQSCHQGAASNDYMFTLDRMQVYLP